MKETTILAIESSCDETAAAVVQGGRTVLSNCISSQIALHQIYGGVVPEIASRKHLEAIDAVVREAMKTAKTGWEEIDAIAVTYGPGLVGALLVGVAHAKALAYALKKPLLGVHHIEGHIAANYITDPQWEPPYLCLVVSGGHTHLVMVEGYTRYQILGKTRDDAAGEAFDKVARAIGLGYPGGPKIDAVSKMGNPEAVHFPRPCLEEDGFSFSFSGLKSAVLNYLNQMEMKGEPYKQADIAASFQAAVVEVLTKKTLAAANEFKISKIAMAGGVSANRALRASMEAACLAEKKQLCVPDLILCTDNAAMIGCAAYYQYQDGRRSDLSLNAVPNLPLQ